jgi:multidrug resistance efflux pump
MVTDQQTNSGSAAVNLLEFQRKLQRCASLRELVFVAANESFHVLRFDQAVVWQYDFRSAVSIAAVSGLAEVSTESPYALWFDRIVRHFTAGSNSEPLIVATLESLPQSISEEGAEWVHEHLLHCSLISPQGKRLGGMFFSRDDPFSETDQAVAQWMASSVAFAYWGWEESRKPLRRWLKHRSTKLIAAGFAIGLAVLGFVPIRLNAIAPAEIVPRKPFQITAPVDGVIEAIKVQPNETVKADQVLAVLDDTSTRNRLAVSEKALEIAKADYQRAVNKAFGDEASRSEINVLEGKIKEKAAEVVYLSELLKLLRITAPQGGIAIFNDTEEWRGRPVQPGERIMTLADPSLVAVSINVSPDDAVQLEVGGDVTIILSIDPLSPLKAKITQTSYEATLMPDNTLAYKVHAEFLPGSAVPRIGLKGSAKVYAEEVSLGYYLFRKPIVFLRKSLGI